MSKKTIVLKHSIFLMLLILPMNINAQKVGEKRITTKYEEFISQSGTFVKFTDIVLPQTNLNYTDDISGLVRTFWGQTRNHYYVILTKSNYPVTYRAMIEYSDLLELNKAFARLLSEVDEDVNLRTEYDYLKNKYVTNDNFKLGYYIEKKKAKWFVKFDPKTDTFKISYQEDLYKLLKKAQDRIEKIMAREGK